MVLDTSVPRQTYIEDCEVCCNPIEVSYTVEEDTIVSFNAKTLAPEPVNLGQSTDQVFLSLTERASAVSLGVPRPRWEE